MPSIVVLNQLGQEVGKLNLNNGDINNTVIDAIIWSTVVNAPGLVKDLVAIL